MWKISTQSFLYRIGFEDFFRLKMSIWPFFTSMKLKLNVFKMSSKQLHHWTFVDTPVWFECIWVLYKGVLCSRVVNFNLHFAFLNKCVFYMLNKPEPMDFLKCLFVCSSLSISKKNLFRKTCRLNVAATILVTYLFLI